MKKKVRPVTQLQHKSVEEKAMFQAVADYEGVGLSQSIRTKMIRKYQRINRGSK